MKRIQRVYLDTSVIGGCFDEEFAEYSNKLFDMFRQGTARAVISQAVLDEVALAPQNIQGVLATLPKSAVIYIAITDEAIALAEKYLKVKAVPRKYYADAVHIALATVERADVLVSWNFKHIVNLNRIKIFNAVNMSEGYPLIEIRSPREVLHD